MSEFNPLFRAHMLLLRWGEESLACEASEAENSEEDVDGEPSPTALNATASTNGIHSPD